MEKTTLKNGVYKSADATYFVKDGKVIMLVNGNHYKTTGNFMLGTWTKDLTKGQLNQFDEVYNVIDSW